MVVSEEYQYLNLVRKCIEQGNKRGDRTGTGTVGISGGYMRFSLEGNRLPLLTTKFVPFRIIFEELLFFIRGQTDNKILKSKNIHIWDGNSTAEFFRKNNINREADDLGPIYGFQWRHFGAKYKSCNESYKDEGIDQLQNIIEALKSNPESRRHVVVAWNPIDLPQMALPPCHCLFQFIVLDGRLDLILYQRSGDMGLGIPFNIASYSLLAILVAKIVGLAPGEFIHFIGDAHVYLDHIGPLQIQLEREPKEFPTIRFADKIFNNIDDICFEDIILENYEPHPKITMNMSV